MGRVVSKGLIDQAAYESALKEIKGGEHYDPEELITVTSVLFAAKRGLGFDVETGELPCRHDLLVLDFVDCTNGNFRPSDVSKQWHQSHDEDWDADYTLQFIFGDRLYRARLRNFGDWYDVELTVQVINRALADSDRQAQFVALESGGQVAEFLFGDPQSLAKLSRKLHLPLNDDLKRAMRLGKEYEEKVLEEVSDMTP